MDPALLDDLEPKDALAPSQAARGDDALAWVRLGCACGSDVFRITGWPRITTGRGGFFWRSVARVFREARQPMEEGELVDAPYWLPLFARCEACEREATLLDDAAVGDRLPEAGRDEPLESFRCRVCRRGRMRLLVGSASDGVDPDRADYVVVACCRACERESRLAWSKGRPSEQEVRLDLLYGRR